MYTLRALGTIQLSSIGAHRLSTNFPFRFLLGVLDGVRTSREPGAPLGLCCIVWSQNSSRLPSTSSIFERETTSVFFSFPATRARVLGCILVLSGVSRAPTVNTFLNSLFPRGHKSVLQFSFFLCHGPIVEDRRSAQGTGLSIRREYHRSRRSFVLVGVPPEVVDQQSGPVEWGYRLLFRNIR